MWVGTQKGYGEPGIWAPAFGIWHLAWHLNDSDPTVADERSADLGLRLGQVTSRVIGQSCHDLQGNNMIHARQEVLLGLGLD